MALAIMVLHRPLLPSSSAVQLSPVQCLASSPVMTRAQRVVKPKCDFLAGLRRSRKRLQVVKAEANKDEPKQISADDRGFNSVAAVASQMFLLGCSLGPPLDGIHSRVGLVVYDVGAVAFGVDPIVLLTNVWVFPLLGTFYAAVSVIDQLVNKSGEPAAPPTLPQVALTLGILAGLLELSAELYAADIPFSTIWTVLAPAAALNWLVCDGTMRGLALAAFIAVSAPISEVPLLRLFHLWHYPQADIYGEQGLVSWVATCYFFYTPFLLNTSRYLARRMRP